VPNPSIVTLIVSEISAFIRTDGQTDMARSTRLVILIKNIYTLWGRKRFLLPVTYFPTNLVYPFTLRVTALLILKSSDTNTTPLTYSTQSPKTQLILIASLHFNKTQDLNTSKDPIPRNTLQQPPEL